MSVRLVVITHELGPPSKVSEMVLDHVFDSESDADAFVIAQHKPKTARARLWTSYRIVPAEGPSTSPPIEDPPPVTKRPKKGA